MRMPVEFAMAHCANQRGAFDQFITSGGEEAALGMAPRQWPARPARCNATEMERGEPIWQTRSTVPISIPNSREAVATSARISPSLSFPSTASRRWRDRLPWCEATASSPSNGGEVMSDALGEPARIHKNQSGAVLLDERRNARVDFVPHFV